MSIVIATATYLMQWSKLMIVLNCFLSKSFPNRNTVRHGYNFHEDQQLSIHDINYFNGLSGGCYQCPMV
ncbi:MAG: hypothetical protein LBU65_06885 [Planctomycetaceae bacterium]|nr:hypothetical protein [Planctomycetaceae bacterium]